MFSKIRLCLRAWDLPKTAPLSRYIYLISWKRGIVSENHFFSKLKTKYSTSFESLAAKQGSLLQVHKERNETPIPCVFRDYAYHFYNIHG
jgi:hypothetical protein